MNAVEYKTVAGDESGIRLDRWFRSHFPSIGHGQLQKLLRKGQIRVDGGRVKAQTRLTAGQSVRVPPDVHVRRPPAIGDAGTGSGSTSHPPELSERDRKFVQGLVIYQDDDVIAINKPSGLAVQGGTRTERHLDGLLDGLIFGARERPRLVHRLDRDTSGVLLLARNREAAARLGQILRTRRAQKLYWALVIGVPRPAAGTVDLPLAKSGAPGGERVQPVREEAGAGGQQAVTDYRVVGQAGRRLAWLEMMPRTGRTHQLRAHAAALGHPIVGDGKYGGAQAHPGGEIPRKLHLHARALRLPHPREGMLEVDAPLPAHMRRTWSLLGLEIGDRDEAIDWEVWS